MGTTVIYSSGDNGVAGFDNVCLNSSREASEWSRVSKVLPKFLQVRKPAPREQFSIPNFLLVSFNIKQTVILTGIHSEGNLPLRYRCWRHADQSRFYRKRSRRRMRTIHFLWRRILEHLPVRTLMYICATKWTNPYKNSLGFYQVDAVNSYVQAHLTPSPYPGRYNNSGNVRTFGQPLIFRRIT